MHNKITISNITGNELSEETLSIHAAGFKSQPFTHCKLSILCEFLTASKCWKITQLFAALNVIRDSNSTQHHIELIPLLNAKFQLEV